MEMKPAPHYTTTSPHGPVVRQERRLNYAALVALIFTLVGIILLAVAVGTNFWIVENDIHHLGLWKRCFNNICIPLTPRPGEDATGFYVIRGCLLASVGATAFSVLLLALALGRQSPKCCAAWAGVLLILASLLAAAVIGLFALVFVLVAVFSPQRDNWNSLIGYSFILACVAVPVVFIAGILSCVAACTERSERRTGVIIAP